MNVELESCLTCVMLACVYAGLQYTAPSRLDSLPLPMPPRKMYFHMERKVECWRQQETFDTWMPSFSYCKKVTKPNRIEMTWRHALVNNRGVAHIQSSKG